MLVSNASLSLGAIILKGSIDHAQRIGTREKQIEEEDEQRRRFG